MNIYKEIHPPWFHYDNNSLFRLECGLGQWQNLLEYILKFFPTISTFKTSVAKKKQYICLKEWFQYKNSEAYLSFMCFAVQDFEAIIWNFQFEQSMIHMLYPSMVEMIWYIITKFIKKTYVVLEGKRYVVLVDDSPKKAEDISIDPLRSDISSIGFVLVLITFKECTKNL